MNLDFRNFTKKQKIISAIGIALILVILTVSIAGIIIDMTTVNLVKNGSFESWFSGKPSEWKIYNYYDKYEDVLSAIEKETIGDSLFIKDENTSSDKKTSVRIENSKYNDVRFYQEIKVTPNKYYKISASFKIDGIIEKGAGAEISIYDQSLSLVNTDYTDGEWQTLTIYGVAGEYQEFLQLGVGLGGFSEMSMGKIWIDNVSMEELAELPEGVDVYNLSATPDPKFTPHILKVNRVTGTWIFRICVIATIIFVLILTIRSDKKKEETEEEEEVEKEIIFEQETLKEKAEREAAEKEKSAKEAEKRAVKKKSIKGDWKLGQKIVDFKETLFIIVITAAYLVLALYNLGGMTAPQTYFSPSEDNKYKYDDDIRYENENWSETITISLGSVQTISRVLYNTNLTSLEEDAVAYKLLYLDETGEYQELMDINESGFYKWHYRDTNVTTDTIKIVAVKAGLKIHEIGFFSKHLDEGYNRYELIGPITVTDIEYADPVIESAIEDYEKWFDEQDIIIPEPTFMHETYFDEIYFPRTAYENLNRLPIYETTHPPLGKLIQAAGIAVFGMNPFGWRIMGTLFGAAMIPLMYLLAKKIFNNKFFAGMAACLMLFDTMHFAQTRLATIDSYTAVFIMFMYYYMYDVFISRSYETGLKKYWKPLILSGLFFGLGAPTKWICLYAGFGLAILFFISRGLEYYNYKKLPEIKPEVKEEPWYKDYPANNLAVTILICIGCFVIIPVIIYCLSYIPYAMVEGNTKNLFKIILDNQESMFSYHSKLTSGHPFSSEWWQWIFNLRPIWYYGGSTAPGLKSTIASFGNPIIWWSGFIALFSSCYIAMKKSDKKVAFILIGYACQLFPWMIVFRASYIYHYFSCLPFLILFIVYVAKHLYEIGAVKKWMIVVFTVIAAIVFILYYPAISGMTVTEDYIAQLKIMESWDF